MSDFKNMLQELKDTIIDLPEAVYEKPKKIKNVSKKKDASISFSQKEMDALSQELLNYSAAYDEPVFNKKTTQVEVENIEKILPIEVKDNSEVIHLLNQIKFTVDRLRLGRSGKNKLLKKMSQEWILRAMNKLERHKPIPEYNTIKRFKNTINIELGYLKYFQ